MTSSLRRMLILREVSPPLSSTNFFSNTLELIYYLKRVAKRREMKSSMMRDSTIFPCHFTLFPAKLSSFMPYDMFVSLSNSMCSLTRIMVKRKMGELPFPLELIWCHGIRMLSKLSWRSMVSWRSMILWRKKRPRGKSYHGETCCYYEGNI